MTEKKTIAFPVGPAPKPIPRACSDVFRLWAALGLGILLSLAFFILQDLYQEMGFRKQLTPAQLALDVHPVEVLRPHRAVVDDAGELEHPVGQRRLAVVDVGDDAEVPDQVRWRRVWRQRGSGPG